MFGYAMEIESLQEYPRTLFVVFSYSQDAVP